MKRVEFNTNDPDVIYEMLSDRGKKTLFSQLLQEEPPKQYIQEDKRLKPLGFMVIVGVAIKILTLLL